MNSKEAHLAVAGTGCRKDQAGESEPFTCLSKFCTQGVKASRNHCTTHAVLYRVPSKTLLAGGGGAWWPDGFGQYPGQL